jgi:hypothetical protein
MAAAQSPVLEQLIANQRAIHQGQPGGLGQAMTAAEREEALLFCQRNKPEKMSHPCTLAPDQAGAHDDVVLYIIRLMTCLIASKWHYKEYEDLTMDWVEDQFAKRAADTWRRVTAVTKRTATMPLEISSSEMSVQRAHAALFGVHSGQVQGPVSIPLFCSAITGIEPIAHVHSAFNPTHNTTNISVDINLRVMLDM